MHVTLRALRYIAGRPFGVAAAVFLGLLLLVQPGPLSGLTAAAATAIGFADLPTPDRPLVGSYPDGALDWGNGSWYLSGPWGQFSTNSVSFNGPIPTSAQMTFIQPAQLLQVDAFNGGTTTSIVRLDCAGQPAVRAQLA